MVVLGTRLSEIWVSLPDIKNPNAFVANQSLVIEDRKGNELFRFYHDEDRTFVSLDEVSPHFINAIIAIEDRRFYSRGCVDWRSLGRAALANLSNFKSQGASTITQQLVRITFLNPDKTFERKLREVLLACQLEHNMSKEEILALYMNWVSFGNGIAGIEQAAQRYFGVPASKLTIPQSALLAAMPQRPTYFSPYGSHRVSRITKLRQEGASVLHPSEYEIGLIGSDIRVNDAVVHIPGRAELVLHAMKDLEYISEEEWKTALSGIRRVAFKKPYLSISAPHLVISLREELRQWQREIPSGLHVTTTIHPEFQNIAKQVVDEMSPKMHGEFHAGNIALLAVDRESNEIVAYVGNTNFFNNDLSGQIDMVRQPRQTGSSFKPFVYAALLEQGKTSESRIDDRPLDPRTYKAFRSGYYGRMTIRYALGRSRNTPAIRAFYEAGGEDAILNIAHALGMNTPKWQKRKAVLKNKKWKYSWPLALGAAESSLLELVQGYSVLAQSGMNLPITAVRQIRDGFEQTVYEPKRFYRPVLAKSTADQLTDILSDEKARETLWRYPMKLPFGSAALKTGTSNICTERGAFNACKNILPNNTWTVGYTDKFIVGVWVGNANNAPLTEDGHAILTSLPIWKEFVIRAHNSPASTQISYHDR